jgi:transcriptional regulator with GAF, ATPase, and Fis domain
VSDTVDADLTSHAGDERVRVHHLVPVFAPARSASAAVRLGVPVVLGREPGAETGVKLDDLEASRVHATIEPSSGDGAGVLVDAGSRNGTYVDGARVSRADLRHGSVVRIGRSLFVVVDVALPGGFAAAKETEALQGQSALMHRLRRDVALVAPTAMAVLVRGETGVGKGNVAAEIHRASGRAGGFVAVNCAAISPGLAETELFGHTTGAFTGATAASEGLFVAAHKGTLFLDEVGELPGALQPKLLRALGSGEVRAVGRAGARQVDVRIVAATNRNIEGELDGQFRGDLFARLSAWTIHVPPLRERKDDVLLLAGGILARHGGSTLSASAAEALLLFDWPFNVRQLENVLAGAAVRAQGTGGALRLAHLPDEMASLVRSRRPAGSDRAAPGVTGHEPASGPATPPVAVTAESLRAAMAKHGGVKDRVWRELGLRSRFALRRLLKKHGIEDTEP